MAGVPRYDRIGVGYTTTRRPDPRIERMIGDALGDSHAVVNVGAGTGSYEPTDRAVVAVEPSDAMVRQRAPGTAPAVRGAAEHLPFRGGAFDGAMAVLTVHHWSDPAVQAGISVIARLPPETVHRAMARLEDDLASGRWQERHGASLASGSIDAGYRLIVSP